MRGAKVRTRIHRFLTGQMSKSTIIVESGEGDMHDLRSLRTGEPRATGRNLERQPPISYHIEVRTLYARRILREKRLIHPLFAKQSNYANTCISGARSAVTTWCYNRWCCQWLSPCGLQGCPPRQDHRKSIESIVKSNRSNRLQLQITNGGISGISGISCICYISGISCMGPGPGP